MRKLLAPILLVGLTACTPSEVQEWVGWWESEPSAALEYAEGLCGGPCSGDDLSFDGDSTEHWTDGTTTEDEWGTYWPWDELAECESGGDWGISTGNGYYGGLQFSLSSWHAAGGSGYPHEHSASEQVFRGEILQDMQGWGAWPTCARIVGLL